MNTKIMIAIVAAFAMLFAGVAVASEAADAEGTYSLTYYVGDGSKVVKQDEAAFTVSDVTSLGLVVPEGKEFAGWYTEADGQGTPYTAGSTYTITGAGVVKGDLYALLTPVATVQYNVGGVVYTLTQNLNSNQITLPELSAIGASAPSGMEFKGWFVDTGDDGKRTSEALYAAGSTVALDSGKIYYADLQATVFTVTFDIDGVKSTVTGTNSDAITFPAAPSKAGFTFKGWAIDGEIVKTEGAKFTADVTYSAVFVEDYALTFEVNGTVYAGGNVSAPVIPKDPAREGYTFAGWSTDGKVVIQDISAAIAEVGAPTKFIAVFEPIDCIVTFTVGDEVVLTQTVKYGELATEPALVPEKEGHDFVGWDFDFTKAITADTEIVAEFEVTPEPEPTGLDNPTVQIMAIAIGVLVIFIVAVLVWKKDDVRVIIVKKLDKSKKPEDPKQ